MPVTPRGIWTPADSDDWDLTVDLAAMALSIDTALGTNETNSVANSWYGVGTIAERDALLPPVRKTNYIWRDSATGLTFRYTGSAWVNTNDVINLGSITPVTSGSQDINSSYVDITGTNLTFTLPSASRVRFTGSLTTYGLDLSVVAIRITNGTVFYDTVRASNSSPVSASTGNVQALIFYFDVPAGTHTFKLQAIRAGGSSTIRTQPTSTNPTQLSVDRIG